MKKISKTNRTKIQYLSVAEKLYMVTDINFKNLTLEASECDMQICEVPDEEVFQVEDFKEFQITLRNWHGKVIEFDEWKKTRNIVL